MGGIKRYNNPKEIRGDLSVSFRSKSLKSINEFPPCAMMGRCGVPYFWKNRNGIIYICQVATFLSVICTIFACLSIGVSAKLTKIGAWSTGTGEIQGSIATTAWVGLSGAVWRSQTGDTWMRNYILWEDDECYADNGSESYCDNCNSAGNSAVGLVVLAAVTRVPSILLLQARILERTDRPLFKFLGFVSEALAFCCFSGATFVWREYCHKQLPFSNDMNYRFGGGFILVGLGLALTCCIAITHIAMPCEPVGAYKRRELPGGADQGQARQYTTSRVEHEALDMSPRDSEKQNRSRRSPSSSTSPRASSTPRSSTGKRREPSPAASASSRGSGRAGFDTGERGVRDSTTRKERSRRSSDSGVSYQQDNEGLRTPYSTSPRKERGHGRVIDRGIGDVERSRRHTTGSSRKKRKSKENGHHSPRSEPPTGAALESYSAVDHVDFDTFGITLGGETQSRV